MRYLLLALLVVAACSDVTMTPSADLQVSAQLSAPELRAGDTVRVNVTVVNFGRAPHRINAAMCPAPFVITTTDGAAVGPADQICTLSLVTKDLAPGESFTYSVFWRGDARGGSVTSRPPALSPGNYLLVPRVPAGGRLIEGDAVEIRILPNPSPGHAGGSIDSSASRKRMLPA